MIIWTGFLIGVLGSLHCIGMCGPIALAVPAVRRSPLLYQAGRLTTYVSLGLGVGAAGRLFALAGFQRGLSIAAGVFMLAAAFGWQHLVSPSPKFLRGAWTKLLSMKSHAAFFGIGILNGLLPCGLVYVALAGAAATGSAAGGAIFMAGFGLGTLPSMLAVSLTGKMIQPGLRLRFQRLVPVALVALSVLFMLRGFSVATPSCCHP